MDISNRYNFYIGTARGTLQQTSCKPNEKLQFSIPDNPTEITALEWGRSADEILIGYKNEQVQLYSPINAKYIQTIDKIEGEGAIKGLGVLDESVIIAKKDGIVTVWQSNQKSDYFSINLEENSTLECCKAQGNLLATGGESNDLKVWDLTTQTCIFRAKSLGHDYLNLPIPTSIRGIAFLPTEGQLTACATKEGHILLYDSRVQRRPVTKYHDVKASFTCLASAYRDQLVLAGTTKGYLQMVDLKKPGKCVKTFLGFTGSVTGVVCDPIEPIVATTSLDRHLRVHNLDTKELVHKCYMKQNLTKILCKAIVKEEKEEVEEEEKEEVVKDLEYEELFDNMEAVCEKKKKKRKNEINVIIKKKKKKTLD